MCYVVFEWCVLNQVVVVVEQGVVFFFVCLFEQGGGVFQFEFVGWFVLVVVVVQGVGVQVGCFQDVEVYCLSVGGVQQQGCQKC